MAAYNSGDAAGIAALFTAAAVFNLPSGAVLKGPEAIQKVEAGRMKAGWTKETVTVTEAHMVGNGIWAVGRLRNHGFGR